MTVGNAILFVIICIVPDDNKYFELPNEIMDGPYMKLTIDNQLASGLIGVTDALEVASVSDLGVLDHYLTLATFLHDCDALVYLQWFVVLEPVEEMVL